MSTDQLIALIARLAGWVYTAGLLLGLDSDCGHGAAKPDLQTRVPAKRRAFTPREFPSLTASEARDKPDPPRSPPDPKSTSSRHHCDPERTSLGPPLDPLLGRQTAQTMQKCLVFDKIGFVSAALLSRGCWRGERIQWGGGAGWGDADGVAVLRMRR